MKSAPGEFRQRGREVGRIEAFSDAVFGLAVTFLMVNLEPPKDFHHLMLDMKGFLVFAACFTGIILIWHEHHVFFRRYGLHDGLTVTMNAALLFVVLLYIYPLRFVFTVIMGDDDKRKDMIGNDDVPTLMVLYSGGFLAVSLLLVGMFWHAHRKRERLALNAIEVHDTLDSLLGNLANALVATVSIAVAWFGGTPWCGVSGFLYFAIGPLRFLLGWVMGVKREQIVRASVGASSAAPS